MQTQTQRPVLFLNHKKQQCGVYQYGKRLFNIISQQDKYCIIYREIDCLQEYYQVLSEYDKLIAIIYNYHILVMPWLHASNIQRQCPNIGIPHESSPDLFDFVANIDPDAPETTNSRSLPRPIFENVESQLLNSGSGSGSNEEFIHRHTKTDIPIFGSFGFGFSNKGFPKIVELINSNYDNAVIKFVIPIADFDPNPNTVHNAVDSCLKANTKPGIILMFTHNFFTDTEILKFLSINTMNIFMYDQMYGRGNSSVIDYAISVNRPLGISDSYMFRHIYSNEICLYQTTIRHILDNSKDYCSKYRTKYSHKNLVAKFCDILSSVCS